MGDDRNLIINAGSLVAGVTAMAATLLLIKKANKPKIDYIQPRDKEFKSMFKMEQADLDKFLLRSIIDMPGMFGA